MWNLNSQISTTLSTRPWLFAVAEWLARRTHWSCWRHGEREVVSSNRDRGNIVGLAGHPLRGCPARLRGHKGSGLWKVWTVPSPPLPSPPLPSPPLPSPPLPPIPCPPLPSPPLPCPALPSPPLPSPPLPSPPSLPPACLDQAGSSRLAEITARRSARV